MSRYYKDYTANNCYGTRATPSSGNAKLLVIPIWFETGSSDYIATSKKESIRSDIQKAYFGTNQETGWRSVKTFYEEESLGNVTITGTVSNWYSVSSYATYASNSNATLSLVTTASDWFFNNNLTEKRSDYDCDKDGHLDGVMLIYAYPDYQCLGNYSYSNFWAYCYWDTDNAPSIMKPTPNQYFWASYDFMFSRSDAPSHTGISDSSHKKGNGDTSHCSIDAHTYIHEMGHMFGLKDYYDYSSYSYTPAGSFSMQDYNVGSHDAFSILALGWGKAYIPTESMTIQLRPMTQSGEMILLTPSWNTYNSVFDEYLLLEYYTPDGVNKFDCDYAYKNSLQGSSQSGIRLWHVDARLLYYNDGTPNPNNITTDPRKSCYYGVVTAFSNTYDDGTSDVDGYISHLGGDYCNFNLLQLIHNSTTTNAKNQKSFSSSSLFKAGSAFSMSQYGKQFHKTGKLDSNIDLGFTFEVDSINSEYATVTVTKI